MSKGVRCWKMFKLGLTCLKLRYPFKTCKINIFYFVDPVKDLIFVQNNFVSAYVNALKIIKRSKK